MLPAYEWYTLGMGTSIATWEMGKWVVRKIFGAPTEYTPSVDVSTSGSPYRTNAFDPNAVVALTPLVASKPKIMKFAWDDTEHSHSCPKCRWYNRVNNKSIVPKICECSQYFKEHYHFECHKCEFKSLMKTADDKD